MFDLSHQGLDIDIVLFFNQFCGKSVFLDTLALMFLSVDALRTAILVALIIGIWEYGKSKNDLTAKKQVILILFSIVISLGIIEILNALIDSPRPIVTYENQILGPIIEDKNTKALWQDGWARNSKHGSFPSDTVALLATLAFGIYFWNKALGLTAILFVLFAGILPRLYFGLHYPSDMLAGSLISFIACLLTQKVNFLNSLSEKILKIEERSPFLFGAVGFYLAYIIADKFILLRKLPLWIRSMLGN